MEKFSDLYCEGGHADGDKLERMMEMIPTDDDAIDASDLFSQLASPTRIRILSLLAIESMCVCEIADVLSLSQPAVSHHARLLRQKGIVKYRKNGKQVVYYISDEQVKKIILNLVDEYHEKRK